MDIVTNEIVVSNLGDPSKELFHIKDRSRNFYMLGSMGLASSISLGIALSQRERVVCLDGDGSLLMNLGSLATIANYNPKNLILIALDNSAYGTTGNQVSFTSGVTQLDDIAMACGITFCLRADEKLELKKVLQRALNEDMLCFIHVIVKPDDKKLSPIPIGPIELKDRFMMAITKGH